MEGIAIEAFQKGSLNEVQRVFFTFSGGCHHVKMHFAETGFRNCRAWNEGCCGEGLDTAIARRGSPVGAVLWILELGVSGRIVSAARLCMKCVLLSRFASMGCASIQIW